jgi:recombination protein RecR
MRLALPAALTDLVSEFKRLPGIGPKAAERIAIWMVSNPSASPLRLLAAVDRVASSVTKCPVCGFYAEDSKCVLCDAEVLPGIPLCVVAYPTDVLPLAQCGSFDCGYHVLGGRLSPLDGVSPDDLAIDALVQRVKDCSVGEVILALGSDIEADATASYIADLLLPLGVVVSKIAQGLPSGSSVASADPNTLKAALLYRRPTSSLS